MVNSVEGLHKHWEHAEKASKAELETIITKAFAKGWTVDLEEGDSVYDSKSLTGPSDSIYEFRKMQHNECTICADSDPEEFCIHDEKDRQEEDEAYRLFASIDIYVKRYGLPLPDKKR